MYDGLKAAMIVFSKSALLLHFSLHRARTSTRSFSGALAATPCKIQSRAGV